MSIDTENSTFLRHALTHAEHLQGSVLTFLQMQVVQNERADIADQLINLEYEGESPIEFAKQHAFKKGQLSILNHLLEKSAMATKSL